MREYGPPQRVDRRPQQKPGEICGLKPFPSRCDAGFCRGLLGLVAAILVSSGAAAGQEPEARPPEAPPRTAAGQPDIQGVWTNLDSTPLEAPGAEAWRDLDALALWFPGINAPDGRLTGPNPSPDFGGEVTALRSAVRRSMVIDPPDGRLPILPAAAAVRDERLRRLTDSWLFHTPWERCITRGVPGAMFPTYNAGHLILQIPGYVVILSEMIHAARIIPLDDRRPRLPERIRQWEGSSRGRWEGATLVVETGNYNTRGTVGTNFTTLRLRGIPQSEQLHVTERLTRVDPDTIQYEVTVEDPQAFARPWTAAMPLNRSPDYDLFEYACHEGNYGLPNTLSGARTEERAGSPR